MLKEATLIKQSTISIDFDETFTADPDLWSSFIRLAQNRGHHVICITWRRQSSASIQELTEALPEGVEIHWSRGMPKWLYAQIHRLNVNIWIDDLPEAIVGSEFIPPLETALTVMIDHEPTGTRIVGKIDLPDKLQKTHKLIEAAGELCELRWCCDDYEIRTGHGIQRHYPSEPYLKVIVPSRDGLSGLELVSHITNIAGHLTG